MFYAVRKGITPGIYTHWDDAKPLVTGFPGAEYKKFKTEEAALDYLGKTTFQPTNPKILNQSIDQLIAHLQPNQAICFVDGSYKPSNGDTSYGLVYRSHNRDANEAVALKDLPDDERNQRNVTGELYGAMRAIELAESDVFVQELILGYDYKGIEEWVTGGWKANNALTQRYRDLGQRTRLNITFLKIKGHTGIEFNELADDLAGNILNPHR